MTQLFIGSEGTLGIIVELTLKCVRIPSVRCGAFIGFDTLHDAATATIGLVQATLPTLCRCELLNADGVRATNKKYGTELKARSVVLCLFAVQWLVYLR
jgi:D-lactate dehydrogenase (cytochrome)